MDGLGGAAPVLVEHFRVDEEHGNPFAVWRAMGSPQELTAAQRAALVEASELPLLEPPRYADPQRGRVALDLSLPRPALSLVRLST